MLNSMLLAPRRPPQEAGPAEQAAIEEAEQLAEQEADDEAPLQEPPPRIAGDGDPIEGEQAPVELQFATLGSMDENSPYRLLVTFTNQGAAVRRAELTSHRYRDLDYHAGYLGHLELTESNEGGLEVRVVGPGTPAAEAGLQVGDRILALQYKDQSLEALSPQKFQRFLAEQTKPKQEMVLEVVRAGGDSKVIRLTLAKHPLDVVRPEDENLLMRTGEFSEGPSGEDSFLFTFEQLGNSRIAEDAEEIAEVALRKENWEIAAHTETEIVFRKPLPEYNVEVVKRYQLEPVPPEQLENPDYPAYDLDLSIEVRNLGENSLAMSYRLDGPNGLPIEGWWYGRKVGHEAWSPGLRDVLALNVDNTVQDFTPTDIANGDVEPLEGRPLAFIGVDAQYFSAMMIPKKESVEQRWIEEVRMLMLSSKPKARSVEGQYANVTCRLISEPVDLRPGEPFRHSYEIFLGPRRPELLSTYAAADNSRYRLDQIVSYGWFGFVAKTMLAILHIFYSFVGNYGIAIIMLTALVRTAMFPLSRKQVQSMVKMQELRPEMEKIKEKYKSDMQKQSQAMQELYRKHNINPLAGCLPMFIQLPVFLGLYRSLMVDIELRQAPLFTDNIRWCSNLAAPDMFYDWSGWMPEFISSGQGIFGLGPYLNLLPLATVALFIVQQKVAMPEPTNEQAALQQKIMKYMMVFMGFIFYKVAAGLCLYFIASSIWGILERKLIPPPTASNGAASPPTTTTAEKSRASADVTERRKKRPAKSKKKR